MQRPFVHPATEALKLESVLYALADPVRLDIVMKIGSEGCLNCSAAAPENLPKSTLSHHFQILREAGIISSERRGTEVVNTVRCKDLEARFPGVFEAIISAHRAASTPAKR